MTRREILQGSSAFALDSVGACLPLINVLVPSLFKMSQRRVQLFDAFLRTSLKKWCMPVGIFCYPLLHGHITGSSFMFFCILKGTF